MNGVNKAIILGTLGKDPEIRYTQSGESVATLSVATSEKWKDKQGQQQEKTEWHRVVMFKKLAEIAGEYLRKGSKVYLDGKIATRKWQDQSGQDRYSTEIVANSMQMLDSRSASASESQYKATQQPARSSNVQTTSNLTDGFDDDIPF